MTHPLALMRHLRFHHSEQRCRVPLPEDARRADAGATQPRQAFYQRRRLISALADAWHSAHSPDDLPASFRRHLRAAARAPRTIELDSQGVRCSGRWLTDRGHEPVLDEFTRHAVAARLAELVETCEASTVGSEQG